MKFRDIVILVLFVWCSGLTAGMVAQQRKLDLYSRVLVFMALRSGIFTDEEVQSAIDESRKHEDTRKFQATQSFGVFNASQTAH